MPLTNRIESLKQRHSNVETKLQEEEKRPSQDMHKVNELKREKLSLKDEITRLNSEQQKAA